MELLDGDQEKELAMVVQDLLKLEGIQQELRTQLGRFPTVTEWMEAVGMTDMRYVHGVRLHLDVHSALVTMWLLMLHV